MSSKDPIQQCAVLAFRQNKNRLKIALVTSLETRRWVLPKGNIEADKSARASAAMEAYEEAGLEGTVAKHCIGTYQYEKTENKGGAILRVAVFPMVVSKVRHKWPEKDVRRRKWMTIDDAVSAVQEKELKKLIADFGSDFERGKITKN